MSCQLHNQEDPCRVQSSIKIYRVAGADASKGQLNHLSFVRRVIVGYFKRNQAWKMMQKTAEHCLDCRDICWTDLGALIYLWGTLV